MNNCETLPVEWSEQIRGLRTVVLIDADNGELLDEQPPTFRSMGGPTSDLDW